MPGPPDYVNAEARVRDQLLSGIGSFSPAERSMFHRLCARWSARIEVARFLGAESAGAEQALATLERLTTKLRSAQIGLLTTRQEGDRRVPDHVVLAAKDSPEFWIALLDEEFSRMLVHGHRLLPTEQRLRERRALPPRHVVNQGDSTLLARGYSSEIAEPFVFSYRLLGSCQLIATTNSIRPLIGSALQRLRADIEDRGLLEELARLLDTSLSDVRSRLGGKVPDLWLQLTRTLVRERSTIAFRKSMQDSDEVFQIAYLVMCFVDAQMGEARERKEQDQLVDEELTRLLEAVVQAPLGIMDQEAFLTLTDQAKERLQATSPAFVHRLNEHLLTPRPRKALPQIAGIGGVYIHRDRLQGVFEAARSQVAGQLEQEYAVMMEALLRSRAPEFGEVLGSRERFNEDVMERVRRLDPLLFELLSWPQVIAEAVVHSVRQRTESAAPEDLKAALARYFDLDRTNLLPPVELFGITVVNLLDRAYSRIGVLRQILLRLSGRYDSLRATYLRRFAPKPARQPPADEPAGPNGPREAGAQDPAVTRVRDASRRTRGAGPERRRPRTAPPPKPKTKSKAEIDQVWNDFNRAIHTKRPSDKGPS